MIHAGSAVYRAVSFLALTAVIAACGNQDSPVSISDLPIYPNAIEGESMSGEEPMFGALKAELRQYSTTDGHDQVVSYYRSQLAEYQPEVISHEVSTGKQTAITFDQASRSITVAVQEFSDEGQVSITLMSVGR